MYMRVIKNEVILMYYALRTPATQQYSLRMLPVGNMVTYFALL